MLQLFWEDSDVGSDEGYSPLPCVWVRRSFIVRERRGGFAPTYQANPTAALDILVLWYGVDLYRHYGKTEFNCACTTFKSVCGASNEALLLRGTALAVAIRSSVRFTRTEEKTKAQPEPFLEQAEQNDAWWRTVFSRIGSRDGKRRGDGCTPDELDYARWRILHCESPVAGKMDAVSIETHGDSRRALVILGRPSDFEFIWFQACGYEAMKRDARKDLPKRMSLQLEGWLRVDQGTMRTEEKFKSLRVAANIGTRKST
ncbi:hypothetical protein ARMGADRAFT_1031518 [Armillaria gallica]|uniref:Uncharacterized protein n=1 Tax=Armillaria gallica TaxID=47427 RepID=A0A2H3DQD6_ARMGA|nr:hypothetical protein ARMGADRAFT_1039019 [Armillaria gallica]PBK91297.1 hypothetical protein ARMGADRAFT_1031518 [Armillaria gallica]